MTAARGQKLLDKLGRSLRDCNLIEDESENPTVTLNDIVRALITTTETHHYEFNETQTDSWARCLSDLTLDPSLAFQALKLGILPAIPRFLQRYKSSQESAMMAGDVSWSDTLIALHNFALIDDQGFPDALSKLSASGLTSIANNLARALKPGLLPSDARDAAARLSNYDAMAVPLIESGVLASLALFLPTVKPFNRLPPAVWGNEALREINHTLQVRTVCQTLAHPQCMRFSGPHLIIHAVPHFEPNVTRVLHSSANSHYCTGILYPFSRPWRCSCTFTPRQAERRTCQ